MKKTKLCCLFVLLSTGGCLGSGDDSYEKVVLPFLNEVRESYKPQVYDGIMEPAQFPNLREDHKTLEGIDSNKDGVRDDLEIFLNRYVKYDYERIVYKNYFRTDKDFYKYYAQKNKDELTKNINKRMKIYVCLLYLEIQLGLPMVLDIDTFNKLEVLYNTPPRNSVLEGASRILVGESYGSGVSTYSERYETCPKEVKNKYPFKG